MKLRKTKTPFVLGPLNGGLRWPPEFTGELNREKEWLTYLRGVYRWLPYARSTYTASAAVLAAFGHTIEHFCQPPFRQRVIDFPEVGIDPQFFAAPADRPVNDRVTFLFAGRLVPYKCPDVAVLAFAKNPALRAHRLIVAGDGPELPRLTEIVKQHNLESCVELIGRRTQAEIGELMRSSDVLAFPSIRELGAGVVVEAMACAMACIVVDYGGPGGLIRDGCGIKVPLGNKEHLIEQFAAQMQAYPVIRTKGTGEQAHRSAMQIYAWTAKGRKTIEVYEWVLGRGSKPDFYLPTPAH